MRKGVILEIKKKYLVILTPNGDFIKGAKLHNEYNVGQEIFFDPVMKKLHFPRVNIPAKISSLAVVALLIICALVFNLFNQNKAYAYVSIDANPSVELVLNKNLKVIQANALNQDGQKVLSEVNTDGKQDFEDVAKKVLLHSKSLGYIDDNSKVVIASVMKNEHEDNDKKRLEKKVRDLAPVANSFHASLKVVNASMSERKHALKSGVSTGKYITEKETKKQAENKSSMNNEWQNANPSQKVNNSNHIKKDDIAKINNQNDKGKVLTDKKNGPQNLQEKKKNQKVKNDHKKIKENHHWTQHKDNVKSKHEDKGKTNKKNGHDNGNHGENRNEHKMKGK